MTSFKGQLQAFSQEEESFTSWLAQFQIFLRINGITEEDNKRDIFLSYVGKKAYNILRDLTLPDDPNSVALDDLQQLLKDHFQPAANLYTRRYRFNKCQQEPGENISTFVARLKNLAQECEFSGFLNDALCSQLILGLTSDKLRKALLCEKNLNFKKAVEISLSLETANKDALEIQQGLKKNFSQRPSVNEIKPASKNLFNPKPCFRCLKTNHKEDRCFFKNAECSICHKVGHIKSACKFKKLNQHAQSNQSSRNSSDSKKQFKNGSTKTVNAEYATEESETLLLNVNNNLTTSAPIIVTPTINGVTLQMELDTGAAVSIISGEEFFKLPGVSLEKSNMKLTSYTGDEIPVLGEATVNVKYEEFEGQLPVVVTASHRKPLFGRDWLQKIRLNWNKLGIQQICTDKSKCDAIVNEFPELFDESLGKYTGKKVKIKLKDGATPKFMKPRPVPYALKSKVEEHLNKLCKDGVLEPIKSSDWATPIVIVPKKDGNLRICGDFKVTINPFLENVTYPLPKPADLFSTLNGGVIFSKIDLSRAYEQLELDDESKKLLVLNTHLGLFRYTRLAYGITTAPAIFQSAMEQLFNGMPYVACYLDDILITGSTIAEHDKNLKLVLKKLKDVGFKIKSQKSEFGKESVSYLGHTVDKFGKHTSQDKVKAVVDAPIPSNLTELSSFLGLVKYYGGYIQNLSHIAAPLYKLTCANAKFIWSKECNIAFNKLKNALVSAPVLAHYDVNLPILLACDASSYGISAVISHSYEDGSERPIAFASRTLCDSEKNYAQIEKESLSLVYGVKNFHQYLYGRKFTLVTDHKPLLAILGDKKGLPSLAAARLQRYAIILSAYDYNIIFKPSASHCNADALSRLPVQSVRINYIDESSVFNIQQIELLPIKAKDIKIATEHDPVLSKVLEFTVTKWPNVVDKEFKYYKDKQSEITVEDNILMWGRRVIIPKKYQQSILNELHSTHQGIVKTKSLARLHVWWPKINEDIESLISKCSS